MKVLLLLLACVAYTAAQADLECGSLQRLKVKQQWIKAYTSSGLRREELGRDMWSYIKKNHPNVMGFLGRVRGDNLFSPQFQAHAVRVFGGFDICISLLTDQDTLDAQLAHLQMQHNERGIPKEYFTDFLNALIEVVPNYVDGFDQDAWSACYGVISKGITTGLTSEE